MEIAVSLLLLIALCLGALGIGGFIRIKLDPAEAVSVGGAIMLCSAGWIIGVLGAWQASGALANSVLLIALIPCISLLFKQEKVPWPLPSRWWLVWALLLAFPLLKAWSPSDMLDWDTIAYHFAVPKLWLVEGKMTFIPFIHQSNFPGIVDNLFISGLTLGEPGAKTFTAFYWILGGMWVFGVARRHFGAEAAPWAALAFLSAPLILWSSGSGYIDVAHGLFAAMGMIYAIEAMRHEDKLRWLLLSGFGLGAAMASKYTGLQVAVVTLFVVAFMTIRTHQWRAIAKPLTLAGFLALLIACPWYIRTYVNTGNPVYPFFYEQLGGRGWDQWRADIYRNEQQSFGVGRTHANRDFSAVGASVLGLAYQPGRYINPSPSTGGGAPMGATGFALLLGPLAWLCFGGSQHRTAPWPPLLAMSGLLLILFFMLSQQVRYIAALAPLWAILLAGISVSNWREILRGAITIQATYTVWLLWTTQAENQFRVVTGIVSREEYQHAVVPFSKAAEALDSVVGKQGKVALYNEVFGDFLDIPYVWANPGHSKIIAYQNMQTGADLASGLRQLGFTHAYLSTRDLLPDHRILLTNALQGQPISKETAKGMNDNLDIKWFRLLCDAIAERELEPIPLPQGAPGLLLRVGE